MIRLVILLGQVCPLNANFETSKDCSGGSHFPRPHKIHGKEIPSCDYLVCVRLETTHPIEYSSTWGALDTHVNNFKVGMN